MDNYITLAWILREPDERAVKFVDYGLGQAKLGLEHRRLQLSESGQDPDEDPMVTEGTLWIEAQRFMFLTEVNIGSWAGLTTRQMAQEAGCMRLYNFAYQPFSAATHSMWHHVARYNLEVCTEPLHKLHRVPIVRSLNPDVDYFYRAAKYAQRAFIEFDNAMAIRPECPSAYGWLHEQLYPHEPLSDDALRHTEEGE